MERAEAQEAFLSALRSCDGLVWNACKMTGLSEKVHQKWLVEDSEYAEKFRKVIEGVNDFVESKLFELIREGNWNAIRFYLSCKCRHRGYANDPSTIVQNNTLNIAGAPVKSLAAFLASVPMIEGGKKETGSGGLLAAQEPILTALDVVNGRLPEEKGKTSPVVIKEIEAENGKD